MSTTAVLSDYALGRGVTGDVHSLALWAMGGSGVGASLGVEALAEFPVMTVPSTGSWTSRSMARSRSKSWSRSWSRSGSESGSWSGSWSWSESLSGWGSRSGSESGSGSWYRSRSCTWSVSRTRSDV